MSLFGFLESPVKLRLGGVTEAELNLLRQHLQYHDKKVDFEISRLKNSSWALQKLGEEGMKEKLAELRAQRVKSLLFEDEAGYWTYSGLTRYLTSKVSLPVASALELPTPANIPWAKPPSKQLRPYQKEALAALLAQPHAGVEIGTGLGKSYLIMSLLKAIGLRSLVMAPSKNIAAQLYRDFLEAFGKKYVGMYGDGKKEYRKLFTVAIDDSLSRLEPGVPAYDGLASCDVFIADESHLCPAITLAKVCFGLAAAAGYRYFFSGTQMRNDGLDLLLDGITGPIVYRMTVEQGVEQGYLARPVFRMISVRSSSSYASRDANKMTQRHLLYNPAVVQVAAEVANRCVEVLRRPTLILVKELEQFAHLLPYLKHQVKFAHGGVTRENAASVPAEYHESDPDELVAQFNRGEIPILVGTSCISTGTDVRGVGAIIYLVGGKSEIAVKQAVGRGTRGGRLAGVDCPWTGSPKLDCIFVDVDVENVELLHKHARARRSIYRDIGGSRSAVEEVEDELKGLREIASAEAAQ